MSRTFLGTELDTETEVTVETDRAYAVFACGKRGTGKSYTLGNIIEEVHTNLPDTVPLIVDPMGIYWTMGKRNTTQEELLWDWGLQLRDFEISLIVPGDPEEHYGAAVLREMEQQGITVERLALNPSDISPDGWCELFDLSINKPMEITLFRAVRELSDNHAFLLSLISLRKLSIMRAVMSEQLMHSSID